MNEKLNKWLKDNGAEVLMPTNPYELARFIAHGGTQIIYKNTKGKISANGFALEAYQAFTKGQRIDMGFVKKSRVPMAKYKAALLKRDGRECFYCGEQMSDEQMTVEHLIALKNGGINRLENMALAHEVCNRKAGSLNIVEKIKLRDSMRKPCHNH